MNWFQEASKRTLEHNYGFVTPKEIELINLAGCIAEESGEIFGALKKQIIHRHGLNVEKIAEEIGDCMWYIAALCTKLGIDMDDVMIANINKLKERYPDGFSVEKSINRKSEGEHE